MRGSPRSPSLTLFPAHAGVILPAAAAKRAVCAIPRPRGGDPRRVGIRSGWQGYSPPTRG